MSDLKMCSKIGTIVDTWEQKHDVWVPLDPQPIIPPKDWKPYCYDTIYCKDDRDEPWSEECVPCPYRKRE
jgi:hypothetical protein